MSQLFNNQSLLTILLNTEIDLSGATVKKILWQKPAPDNTKGFWVAEANGKYLYYDVQTGDINVAGIWKFQAYVEIGGKKAYGEIVTQSFDNHIQ